MKEIVKNILLRFIESDITVDSIFEKVEVELREQEESGWRLIHFVNYTGQMRRPIDGIIPCKEH